jgi:dTMP kinase
MAGFVVIEGLDGAGTTTQAARLVAALRARGHEVLDTREPTEGPIGRQCRAALGQEPGAPLRASLPWLYAADRADHLARTVEPALARGAWVVSDRYYHSSLAYQSLDVPLAYVATLNQTFRAPDVTVFLEASADLAVGRLDQRGSREEIFDGHDTLSRVARQYRKVLDMVAARGERVVRLDASGTIDEIAVAVLAAVDAHVPS